MTALRRIGSNLRAIPRYAAPQAPAHSTRFNREPNTRQKYCGAPIASFLCTGLGAEQPPPQTSSAAFLLSSLGTAPETHRPVPISDPQD